MMFVLQMLLLLIVIFIIGCVCGYWLHSLYGAEQSGDGVRRGKSVSISPQDATRVAGAGEPSASSMPRSSKGSAPSESSAQRGTMKSGSGSESGTRLMAANSDPAPLSGGQAGGGQAGGAQTGKADQVSPAKPAARTAAKAKPKASGEKLPAASAAPPKGVRKSAASSKSVQAKTGKSASTGSKAKQVRVEKPAALASVPGTASATGKPAKSSANSRKAATGAGSASASKRTAKPVVARASAARSSARGRDDLKRIKGVGPKVEAQLHEAGITTFAQIAGWTAREQAEFGEHLSFSGRIEREDWVSQARAFAGEAGKG